MEMRLNMLINEFMIQTLQRCDGSLVSPSCSGFLQQDRNVRECVDCPDCEDTIVNQTDCFFERTGMVAKRLDRIVLIPGYLASERNSQTQTPLDSAIVFRCNFFSCNMQEQQKSSKNH